MKKIFIILLTIFLLSSCKKSIHDDLIKLGYSDEEANIIETLNEETQEMFLLKYQENLLPFIVVEGFDEDKLGQYVKHYGELEPALIVETINAGIDDFSQIEILSKIKEDEYYLERNKELYLEYYDQYDTVRDLVEVVNTKRYEELYSDIQTTDLSKGYLILVNKYFQLPSDYEPDDLVQIAGEYGIGQTRAEVYEAYKELYDAAILEGHDLIICSAYRSYDYQEGLYNKYLGIDPQEVVDTYSARPGHSEHQSGLCLDVTLPGVSLESFYLTDASDWLAENCYKWGFIIRYGVDKEPITGYESEPWQIRYVGSKEIAYDIYQRGITFDEYYACFVE